MCMYAKSNNCMNLHWAVSTILLTNGRKLTRQNGAEGS